MESHSDPVQKLYNQMYALATETVSNEDEGEMLSAKETEQIANRVLHELGASTRARLFIQFTKVDPRVEEVLALEVKMLTVEYTQKAITSILKRTTRPGLF